MKRVILVLAAMLVGGAGARDSNGIGYSCWSSFSGGYTGAHIGTDGSVTLWKTRIGSQGVDYTPLPNQQLDYPRLAATLDEARFGQLSSVQGGRSRCGLSLRTDASWHAITWPVFFGTPSEAPAALAPFLLEIQPILREVRSLQ